MLTIDHYEILDVSEDAKPSEIRRAYYRLAKMHHPDLQGSDAGEDTHERFLSIQKAYEVLASPEQRLAYDEDRREKAKTGGSSQDAAVEADDGPHEDDIKGAALWSGKYVGVSRTSLDDRRQARQAFMRAEECLEMGEVEKAIPVLQAVVRAVDDEADYLSLLGYALAMNGEKLHKARDLCRRALEIEPHSLDHRARLGYVYLRAGLKKTADEYFEQVLTASPTHPIARAHTTAQKSSEGGLFAKLGTIFGSKRG